MINIVFLRSGDKLTGYRVSGHSDYAEQGSDIICAAVSSAAYMTANTVTDVLNLSPELNVSDGEMLLELKTMDQAAAADDILSGFWLHITELQKQYPDFIHVNNTEV